jgi:phage tail-like protein
MQVNTRQQPPQDPFLAFGFTLAIDGIHIAGFNEVSGLAFEVEVETMRVGGVNEAEWQIPGPSKFPLRLVLKRGLGDAEDLWNWYRNVAQGAIERKNIAITLNATQGSGQRSWSFLQACPVKWNGPEFRAMTSAVAFEAIELVHRGLVT